MAGAHKIFFRRARRAAAAFTMLETLMVLALGGMLLLAASSFLFGVITLRREVEQSPQLAQHSASVARLLESLIGGAQPQQAGSGSVGAGGGSSGGSGGGTSGNSSGTARQAAGSMSTLIAWQSLPSSVASLDPALYLKARAGLPVFIGESGLVDTSVDCYLLFEPDNGLVLLWQSPRMKADDESNWQRSVISPLITAVRLLYYDADQDSWEDADGLTQVSTDTSRLPQVMQLTFRDPRSAQEIRTEVLLPVGSPQLFGL